MITVSIVGGGGWGTALAASIGGQGIPVKLWVRRSEHAKQIQKERENKAHLPGVFLPPTVSVTDQLEDMAGFSHYIIVVVPSQAVRSVIGRLAPCLTPQHRILVASKGLEVGTHLRMSQVIEEIVPGIDPKRIACISGPNHAEEVGRGIPSATVVASPDESVAGEWQRILMTESLRVYTTDDLIGVELGGALKNVIALAAGISDGLGFGDNTRAALVTRGLAEMVRLGMALGARPLTFSGLAGIGDLMATCNSRHSRNRSAGEAIGRGVPLESILENTVKVIEGIPTCKAALGLAQRYGVDMPISESVYGILYRREDPRSTVSLLMTRGPKSEWEPIPIISRQYP